MKPKISTKQHFDYDDMINKSKYAFIYDRCGNHGNESRPMVVIDEDDQDKCIGYEISIYNNGIEINAEFSMPKSWVNTETLTTDVNGLLCSWLTSQGEYSMVG